MSINLDAILKIEGYTRENRAHRELVCKQIQTLPYRNMKLFCHLIKTGREFLKTYDTKKFDQQKRLLKKDYAEIQKVRKKLKVLEIEMPLSEGSEALIPHLPTSGGRVKSARTLLIENLYMALFDYKQRCFVIDKGKADHLISQVLQHFFDEPANKTEPADLAKIRLRQLRNRHLSP
jgi:hypothetical protein